MSQSDILFDYKHIWHPYSSIINPLFCHSVISAKGVYLRLKNGKKHNRRNVFMVVYYTWIQSSYTKQSFKKQIKKMSHVMFGGINHPAAILLCRKLIKLTPKKLDCVFLSDSGSIAIEVAIKMLIQYWQSLGENRTQILTIRNSYHGDTFGAMSISDPKNSIHKIYNQFLPKNLFANAPTSNFHEEWNANDIISFKKIIEKNRLNIAGVILEPIVQGVGGMKFYHPMFLKKVEELCKYYKIPLVFDEIATGFGRTGKFFAFQHANVIPDILCLGKAMTGGTVTLAATITSRNIANIISNSNIGCFMHGPTYMGNPLACSVAYANIKILEKNEWKKQIVNIEKELFENLSPLIHHPRVLDIRVLGAIGVVECKQQVNLELIQKFFVKHGVWIRPFKKLIYIVPPYIISINNLKKLIKVITKSLNENTLFI